MAKQVDEFVLQLGETSKDMEDCTMTQNFCHARVEFIS